MIPHTIRIIALDADDTLWDCQSHFERVENMLFQLLEPWCTFDEAKKELFVTEHDNMSSLGYGSKAFTLSVLQTALRVSQGTMPQKQLNQLLQEGCLLNTMPATPLPGVTETLRWLQHEWRSKHSDRRIIVLTKGDLLEQENKLIRSGLLPFFDNVYILSKKDEDAYLRLCLDEGIQPAELLAVGNSFKSDIAPALNIGASAIHIPFHVVWQLEQSEEFEHNHLIKIDSISALPHAIKELVN